MTVRLAHITVVHPRFDTRILFKECASLSRNGVGQVSLFVADGQGGGSHDGVRIHDVGVPRFGRLGRATVGSWRMWRALRRFEPDLVHVHDPELLPLALLLSVKGTRVVFDMHENLPREIATKPWVRKELRPVLASVARAFQTLACRRMATVFAEESYVSDFPAARRPTVVLNFPLLGALSAVRSPKRPRFTVGYIGGVSRERGAHVVVEAVSRLRESGADVELLLVGPVFSDISDSEAVRRGTAEGWLTYTGRLVPEQGWALIAGCHVGVAALQPSPNFVDSYPTKLFEYMALGLPVVVSDFPLWRGVVDDAGCGLLVDPTSPAAVANAIERLYESPADAAAMGERGRATVNRKYNWESEFAKLKTLYAGVLSGREA